MSTTIRGSHLFLAGLCGLLSLLMSVPGLAAGAGLPDGRVYEQVTPVDKNGADVLPNPQRTVAAADGSAVQFTSLEGFGDVRGFGVSTDYVARRGGDGTWATHGITPPQEPGDLGIVFQTGFESRYLAFSDDLSHGVFIARSPLTDAPNVAEVINMYTRDDVLEPGAGSYDLLTAASSSQTHNFELPWVADASEDFSHVIFESKRRLTPDAVALDPGQPKLYERVDGSVRLAGVLPADEGGGPTVSQAGRGVLNKLDTQGTISRDGRRVIFTAPPFFDNHAGGVLYVRDDQNTPSVADDESTRVSASERTDCNDDPSCGGDGVPDPSPDPANPGGEAQAAIFWAASADASQIFFTTSEQMTDDDVNGSSDLYRFDLEAAAGSRLTRLSVDEEPSDNVGEDLHNGHEVSGVLGASADGSYVYFAVGQGQLVAGGRTGAAGGPDAGARIYRWHDGALRHVGTVNGGGSVELPHILGTEIAFAKWSRVSPDGEHVVFLTQGTQELLSLYGGQEYDHGTGCPSLTATECQEAYVYDATANSGEGRLQCASCNPTGQRATADADLNGGVLERGGAASTLYLNRVMSDDGRFVFFNSAERLSPDDENAAIDAYQFNTATGRVHLISSGRGSGDQLFMNTSADGSDVFFLSREQLRSTDRDQSLDLYDARVNGAPDLGVTEVVPCSGDGCRGPLRASPELGGPASDGFDGAGNVSGGSRSTISGIRRLSSLDRSALARGGKARLKLRVNRSGRVTLAGRAKVGSKNRRVASSFARARKAGDVSIPFALSRSARAELSRRRSLAVRLTIRFEDARPKVVVVTLRASAKGKGGAR